MPRTVSDIRRSRMVADLVIKSRILSAEIQARLNDENRDRQLIAEYAYTTIDQIIVDFEKEYGLVPRFENTRWLSPRPNGKTVAEERRGKQFNLWTGTSLLGFVMRFESASERWTGTAWEYLPVVEWYPYDADGATIAPPTTSRDAAMRCVEANAGITFLPAVEE